MPASISTKPSIANMAPIGSRMSSPISIPLPKDHVKYDRQKQNDRADYRHAFVPNHTAVGGLVSQRIHKTNKLAFRPRLGNNANQNCDYKTCSPGKDRCPEILRHLASVGVNNTQPPSFDPGDSSDGKSQSMMNSGRERS